MPSYAELENWRNRNLKEFVRWHKAAIACYESIAHLDVQAAVDQTPNMLISRRITYAVMLGMGYDLGKPQARAQVIAKMVEMRLDS